jgi:2-oxoglutarate dehydrogenase E1 component
MLRPLRKPLIVMTPKSLLRHELAVSPLTDLTTGRFRRVIDEVDDIAPAQVQRVVFCSGKVYYDLLKTRRAAQQSNVALVRVEQLYPFPTEEYQQILARYAKAGELVWCQEEPQNQGAWYQIRHRLQELAGEDRPVYYAGRPSASAPATGLSKLHEVEQQRLVNAALNAEASDQSSRGAVLAPLRKSS